MRQITLRENIRPILGAIKTVPIPAGMQRELEEKPKPFVTLSRQPGAGAWKLAQEFVEAVNAADPEGPQWTCWDRELVEKVAEDHHLAKQLVESLEESSHSWLGDFFTGLSYTDQPDELRVYRHVATTIRALAQAGRVVIVGRGAAFVTRRMPGGIHVRLIAPLGKRIDYIAHSMNKTQDEAARWIAQAEKNRAAFFRRFWPHEKLEPESFTLTLNTAELEASEMIELLRVLARERGR